MSARTRKPVDLGRALVIAWKTSARVTEYLLENLDGALWRAETAGEKGRTIASIFAHIHNVRHMRSSKRRVENNANFELRTFFLLRPARRPFR